MPDEKGAAREGLFEVVETSRDAVAALTGIKNQFLDAGWSNYGAEQMTINLFRAGTRGNADG